MSQLDGSQADVVAPELPEQDEGTAAATVAPEVQDEKDPGIEGFYKDDEPQEGEGEQGEEEELDPDVNDDLPPIAAPNSWKAEEKELFAELPRKHQEIVARRESERTNSFSRRRRKPDRRRFARSRKRSSMSPSFTPKRHRNISSSRRVYCPRHRTINCSGWAIRPRSSNITNVSTSNRRLCISTDLPSNRCCSNAPLKNGQKLRTSHGHRRNGAG